MLKRRSAYADALCMGASPSLIRDVRLGSGLCAVAGMFIAATSNGFAVSGHDRLACLITGGALAVVGGLLLLLPWGSMSRRWLLVAPALIAVALGVLGLVTVTIAQSFLACLVLVAVYLGLTQPPGMVLFALPALTATWWLAFPAHPSTVLVSLPLEVAVWMLVSELIARSTSRAQRESDELRTSSLQDPLTRVGNRRELDRGLAALAPAGLVMFLDLDHFKLYNDRYGHAAGDDVLVEFATVMARTLREGDLITRFGGEEFVVLLPAGVPGHLVYERLKMAWEQAGGPVTFSAGAARRRRGEDPEVTLHRADVALYRAKSAGRDRLAVDHNADAVEVPRQGLPADLADPRFSVGDVLKWATPSRRSVPREIVAAGVTDVPAAGADLVPGLASELSTPETPGG